MQAVEQPSAERGRLPQLVRLAASEPAAVAARRGPPAVADRVAALIGAWRARHRARRLLESWLTIDPHVLADIGLRPAEVQAVVYGGVAAVHLADRSGRWARAGSETVAEAHRLAPQLRLIAGDDLDAAA